MLRSMSSYLHDPDRTILHRALRVAIVMPLLFAFGLLVLHDRQFALIAAFGSFSALAMADFMGPRRSRLLAHLGAGRRRHRAGRRSAPRCRTRCGPPSSRCSWSASRCSSRWRSGGQVALGNNAAILAFVVAVMVPGRRRRDRLARRRVARRDGVLGDRGHVPVAAARAARPLPAARRSLSRARGGRARGRGWHAIRPRTSREGKDGDRPRARRAARARIPPDRSARPPAGVARAWSTRWARDGAFRARSPVRHDRMPTIAILRAPSPRRSTPSRT